MQSQYQAQFDILSKEGQAEFQFVDYDPPAFVIIGKQVALQMTLRNTLRFDIEKSSIYKRAAQTFDLFLAPKLKDVLEKIPNDNAIALYDFSVVNLLTSSMGAKERSEAVEPWPATTIAGLSDSIRLSDSSHICQSAGVPASRLGRYSLIRQSPVNKTPSSGTQTDRLVAVCPGVSRISTVQPPRSKRVSLSIWQFGFTGRVP